MDIYSRFTIQNFDNWRFWIRKKKCIDEFNKEQDHIDRIYLYAGDLNEPRYEKV